MEKLIFDIESTGLDPQNDRIVQLAIMVIDEEGNVKVNKSKLYNPEIPISKSAQETHGISDKHVKDAPTFDEDAKKLKKLFEGKILIGYNLLRFDLPMLMAEFARAEVDVTFSGKYIDILLVEKKLNSNKLEDVYYRYTGEEMVDAHDALADINATRVVMEGQMKKVMREAELEDPLAENADPLDLMYELSGTKDLVDITNKLKRDDKGYLIFNFGKSMNKRVIDDVNYANWILKENFPAQVKDLIRAELTKDSLPKKEQPQGFRHGFKPITVDDDLPF